MPLKILAGVALLGVLAAIAVALGGGGSHRSRTLSENRVKQASVTPAAATTGPAAFASHAGMAFGAFYRFIYDPFRAGKFNPAAPDKAALTQAGLAAKYVTEQLGQAVTAARSNASLAKLVPPVQVLEEGFRAALVKLQAGHFKLAEIQAANLAIGTIKGAAQAGGLQITETAPSSV